MLAVCCSLALGLAPTPTSTEEVHPERQAQLAAIRAASPKWHAAPHPRFAAEAPGASKPLMGVQGDWKADMEALILQGEVHRYESSSLLTAQDIPESFDSETNWPQCADIIGEPSISGEAELLAAVTGFFASVGVTRWKEGCVATVFK